MHQQRDHLFISYAWEDSAFVEWLALKLTSAGYLVWRDQTKLLGGEPYPADIDAAIKHSTFRVLAVLSRHSINKENPRKERTLALNLSRERKESDFLVPLNVDGLRPAQLDWMTSDLSFISFSPSWAEGLRNLLKKLESISAPQPFGNTRSLVPSWIDCRDSPVRNLERLWSNVFPIVEMPSGVLCFSSQVALRPYFEGLPFIRQSDYQLWAFECPLDLPLDVHVREVPWQGALDPNGDVARKVVRLLRLYMWDYLALRGLQRARDEDKTIFYFPEESEGKRKPGCICLPRGRASR